MKSDIAITQDGTENCGMEEHLEKTTLSHNECGSVEKTSLGILNNNDDARKKSLISSKKMSTECASSAENTSGASSSSVSKATISGTLPQPTSRRQNFITLEKFDGSENRPFSLSPLSNMSSAVIVKNNQESMTKTDIPLKAKKREVALSRSDSEKIVHGNKRTGLRSSKAEQTGNKRSKLLMRSDQEKNTQESIEGMVTLENNTVGLLNQTECVLDNQSSLSEPAVEHEDAIPKPTIENALSENSTVEEKTLGSNLESKENTPPTMIPLDQMVNEDSHVQITPNQKTLRRSLRRRSDISEAASDSQDKENNHQKREKRKEEEKTPQKSPLHVKDDVLPKPKVTPEQSIQENLTEKDTLHQKTFGETSTNVEIDKNRRKPDPENIKSEGDTAQDITDKSFEKPVRGRTRYQTRRASQGLLSSIENSESDSSEAKDEGSRKKRSGKWKNKNSDSLDIEDKEEKTEKQECVKIENHTLDCKANSEVDINIKSQICEKDESNTVALQDSILPSDLSQVCDLSNTYEGKSKTNKCAELSFSNSSVAELNLRTRNANKRLHKRDSIENNSVEECSKIVTSDISLASEKNFQAPECRHKRSRRVRRSKGCDCCGEKSQPQEKSPLGLTNTENYNVKVTETKKLDVQTPLTVSETSKTDIYSEVKLSDEHHSVNFHLGLKEENDTVNDSLIVPETELKENNQYSLPSEIINFKEEACDMDSKKAVAVESQEPSNKKCKTVDPCLGSSKGNSPGSSTLETKEGKPEATREKDISTENIVNVEADTCKVKAEFSPEEVEAVELDVECDNKSEASFSEQKNAKAGIFKEEATEEKRKRISESEVCVAGVLNAEETVSEEFNSAIGHPDNTTPVKVRAHIEVSEQTAVGLDGGNSELDTGSSEMENCEGRVVGEVNAETDHISEMETRDMTTEASKLVEAERSRMNIEIDSFVPDTLETSTEEGKVNSHNTETNIVLNKPEETKLDDSQMKVENKGEVLPEVHYTSEKGKETSQSLTSERAISGLITEDNNTSPQKLSEFDSFLLSATDSPSGMQTRCFWSPSASPSSSILKRGLKRPQEDEISSPIHKVGV